LTPRGLRAGTFRRQVAPDQFRGLAALAQGTRAVDDWYVGYVDALPAGDFDHPVDFTFTSEKPVRMTRGEIIVHVTQHRTYHRGNAGILSRRRASPPVAT
jgi:uncharacterized damage-inducible protein DinB